MNTGENHLKTDLFSIKLSLEIYNGKFCLGFDSAVYLRNTGKRSQSEVDLQGLTKAMNCICSLLEGKGDL